MSRSIPYEFDTEAVGLVLEGLDHLPHGRVKHMYQQIQAQARHVLSQPEVPAEPLPAPPRRLVASRVRKQVR